MQCPKCGADNFDDAAFCTLCYTRFGAGEPGADAVADVAPPTAPAEGIVGPKRPAGHGLAGKTAAPIGHERPATDVDFSDPAVRAGLLGESPGGFPGVDGTALAGGLETAADAADLVVDAGILLEGIAEIIGGLSGD
jgi:hypothetical protein